MQNNTNDNAFSNNKLPQQGYSNTLHDVASVDPYQIAQQQRVMPRELKAGSQRGEMVIQGKLTVRNPETAERILVGNYNNEFGLFGATIINNDENNLDLSWKIIGKTRYIYNNGENFLQDGVLPDSSGGFIIVKSGNEVADVYN